MNAALELAVIATELETAGQPGLAQRLDSVGEGKLTAPQVAVELATIATDAELVGLSDVAKLIDAVAVAKK
jgi:hypothetical protein